MSNTAKTAPRAAFTLHQRYAEPQGFDTIRDLHRALRELPGVREYFNQPYWGYHGQPGQVDLDVRVYEAAGRRRVDLEDPFHRIYSYPWDAHTPWNEDLRPRGQPIPGTGKRGPYCYYRYPRTQRDRRLGYPVYEEGEPPIRGNRIPRMLPTCWEDLPRRSWRDRSWKRFRDTQWR